MKKILTTFLAVSLSACGPTESIATLVTVKDQKVGIATENPDELLTVNGSIHTKEVRVDLDGSLAPDYVFDHYKGLPTANSYTRMPLDKLKAYVRANGHLPMVPTQDDLNLNGMDLKAFSLTLLEKIEELTLYLFEQQEQIETLKNALNSRADAESEKKTQPLIENPSEKIEN